MHVPRWLRADPAGSARPGAPSWTNSAPPAAPSPELSRHGADAVRPPVAARAKPTAARRTAWRELLEENGFDRVQHEQIRADLTSGRIGLAQNRLPANADIEDVRRRRCAGCHRSRWPRRFATSGVEALAAAKVAVVTLAAGAGSRWTRAPAWSRRCIPFCKLAGAHRTFIETHLAKSRRIGATGRRSHCRTFSPPAISRTPPSRNLWRREQLRLSRGRCCFRPADRWAAHDPHGPRSAICRGRKCRSNSWMSSSKRCATACAPPCINWARAAGEGERLHRQSPAQCLHPVGHWFEMPNLLRNGVLARLLDERPQLKYLMLHNIDTLGADAGSRHAWPAHRAGRLSTV